MSVIDSTPSDRLHGLDALRGGALLLGVVLHAAMAYLTVPVWPTGDVAAEPVANGVFFAIHLFRMSTFFLIAGLFAHMMLARRGWLAFARDRLTRIAAPLAVFWGVALGGIIAVIVWAAARANGGIIPDGPPPPGLTVETFPLTHLWFLWLLLIFYGAMLLLRAPFAMLDRDGAWGRAVDRLTGALVGPWTPLVLAAPLALALWSTPIWIPFFGIPTPDIGLMPELAAVVGYGVAFAFGFLLDRRRDLLARIAGLWPVFGVIGAGTGVAAFILTGGPAPELAPVTDGQARAGLAVIVSVAVFASTLAVTALALRFFSGVSRVRRYLADASYWVYIIHLPLVMAGQVMLLDVSWPWWIKLTAVAAGVMAVALLSYELLVRHSFIGRWLNGRRIPWGRRPAPAALPAE